MKKTVLAVLIALIITVLLTACANFDFAVTGEYVVTPKEALKLLDEGAILVDAQSMEEYAAKHIEGAINIPMGSLVVNDPYKDMLAEADQIQTCMSGAGISEGDTLLVYDNSNNMVAARIQWTLNMYSNFNVLVVSGGLSGLEDVGAYNSTTITTLPPVEYLAGDKQKALIVSLDYIKAQINTPSDDTVIIDTRSIEE